MLIKISCSDDLKIIDKDGIDITGKLGVTGLDIRVRPDEIITAKIKIHPDDIELWAEAYFDDETLRELAKARGFRLEPLDDANR